MGLYSILTPIMVECTEQVVNTDKHGRLRVSRKLGWSRVGLCNATALATSVYPKHPSSFACRDVGFDGLAWFRSCLYW
jgi:hypothetical protein